MKLCSRRTTDAVKTWLDLAWTFIKIGATTFGGGYAMIPVLERELIKKKGWITMEEVMDYYTIAQITPGVIAVNVSTFVGCRQKGTAGGIAATLSFVFPGVTLMIVIALFISRFAEYAIVKNAFAGIRIAVGALILDTGLKLILPLFQGSKKTGEAKKPPLQRIIPFFIAAAAFVFSVVFSTSPVFIIAGAGIAGFLFWRPSGKDKIRRGA